MIDRYPRTTEERERALAQLDPATRGRIEAAALELFSEREFHRVNATVARDLSGYPGLNRRIADQIQRIDEDFRASTDVPPTPPAWTQAVAAVANVPSTGDPVVGRILGDIHKTIQNSEKSAIEAYRKASQKRHLLLQRRQADQGGRRRQLGGRAARYRHPRQLRHPGRGAHRRALRRRGDRPLPDRAHVLRRRPPDPHARDDLCRGA